MLRNAVGIASGMVVLILGVIAVVGLLRPEEAPAETAPIVLPAAIPTTAVTPTSVVPELPGVSNRISRVLEWNGDARFADDEQLTQLPSSVVVVLTEYGVPLRIPLTGTRG